MDADADADISTYQPEYREEIETAWIVVSELKNAGLYVKKSGDNFQRRLV